MDKESNVIEGKFIRAAGSHRSQKELQRFRKDMERRAREIRRLLGMDN